MTCSLCGGLASRALGVCRTCLLDRRVDLSSVSTPRQTVRARFGLPPAPPQAPEGRSCGLCVHRCRIPEGGRGFCGLRTVTNGRLVSLAGTPARGVVRWYHDPLPTNCVADWVCEGHLHPGQTNLAIFYGACTMDCVFCQNWHFRGFGLRPLSSARQVAHAAGPGTWCACFFGGDPASQMAHALAVGRLLARRGVRVCWETNGTMHPRLLDAAVSLSLATGGCVKFDLKAWDPTLYQALTGADRSQTYANFVRAFTQTQRRQDPPALVASTLLVPGYVTAEEVGRIAQFIASLDPRIPYALLAFAPHYLMDDLPTTGKRAAAAALEAALAAGLQRVRVGNVHLLRED